jgi:hypothetical protein
MAADPKDPCAGREIDPAQDPCVAQMLRKASGRAYVGGLLTGLLLLTVVALVKSEIAKQFWHGAGWGFGIGLGILLGGTVLNVVVGLLDQVKSDIVGN